MSPDTMHTAPGQAIVLHMSVGQPHIVLEVPAAEDSLPLVRQALRSLGETVGVEAETLEDVELAVTEACANAIEHAYEEGGGEVRVELASRAHVLDVGVQDHGVGIRDFAENGDGTRGFGLAMIRNIATAVDFRPGDGTDLRMEFALGETDLDASTASYDDEAAERIVRRLVASVAAQLDMPSDRLVEALLIADLLARNGFARLAEPEAEVRIVHEGDGFELSVGPLAPGGGQATIDASEVPIVGAVLARLATEVRIDSEPAGEHLAVRIDPR